LQLYWSETQAWVASHARLLLPFLIAIWISWGDLRTRKIPNYLTLSAALAGLVFNFIVAGWGGLADGFLGLFLGFGFLILPYIFGGMGAGDVKALAALGAWLGPKGTLYLFCYMGIAGGVMALVVLAWKGILWQKIRRGLIYLHNLILCQDLRSTVASTSIKETTKGIPYGVAIALGMGVLLLRGGA
jgi:prepilin peptidase CpaA